MSKDAVFVEVGRLTRLSEEQILVRVKTCPRLPSLSSINSALRELLSADQRYTSQVAEIIRRDPSLTSRLLRLVNSVYYGLSTPINSIEEAVFYLGVRQIRQLVMVTPIVEDLQKLVGNRLFAWRELWQHCIATAIMTCEVTGSFQPFNDEVDYLAGLVHDVGKITMATVFPNHFTEIYINRKDSPQPLCDREMEILGMDHAELGALYLKSHNLPPVLVEAARYHHHPEAAPCHARIVAAVQVADLMVQASQIGHSGNPGVVTDQDCEQAEGWKLLCSEQSKTERSIAHASFKRSLERLPSILEGLV